jgi:hypothetical protein
MKKEQRASENIGWAKKTKRDVSKCLMLDVLFCTKETSTQAAWAISVQSLGNTIPNINARKNKKSVGLVNRKLAD